MKIIPAILETQLESVAEKLAIIQADGHFSTIQIDVIDGQLFPTVTVTPFDLTDLDFGDIQLDFHLMTEEPLDYVWEIAAQGAALPVHRIFGQLERMGDQFAFLQAVKQGGWQAGLALDLDTPLDSIDENAWSQLDAVLLLAVPMGEQGQVFDPSIYQKITDLQQEIATRQLDVKIIIDGGVKPGQLADLQKAQIDTAVIGSFLWSGQFATQAAEIVTD